jgi:hypothetical protein
MAYEPRPNSGILNRRDKGVDWNGQFSVEGDLLKYIMDAARRGEIPKIEIAGWDKTSPRGDFISIVANIPYELRKEQGGQTGGASGNRYAQPVRQEPARGQPGPTNRYAEQRQAPVREEAPAYRPVRGGIAEQAMGRPVIQTTRGPYPVQGQRPSTRPGTQQNIQFRQELDDELPEEWGKAPARGSKPGWE